MARLTWEQIHLSAQRLAPWRRNYSQSPKRQLNQIIPFVGTRTVLFTGSFWGLTENAIHLSNILIMDCEIIEEKPQPIVNQQPEAFESPPTSQQNQQPIPENGQTPQVMQEKKPYGSVVNSEPGYSTVTHFKVTYGGKNYWVKKFDLRRQSILVRCSCSDYYFTWSWANYMNGIQFGGRARPYVRKTKDRKPRNPSNIPGLCKHVFQFAQMLQTSGYGV